MVPPTKDWLEITEATAPIVLADENFINLTSKDLEILFHKKRIQEEEAKKQELVEGAKKRLLHRSGMIDTDNENMQTVISFFQANNMLTPELIDRRERGIMYTGEAIIIEKIPVSRKDFIPGPDVEFSTEANESGIYPSTNKEGIFYGMVQGQKKYFLRNDAYLKLTQDRGIGVTGEDISTMLKALLGAECKESEFEMGNNILWILLDIPMTGSVGVGGRRHGEAVYGCLGTASSVDKNISPAYRFDKERGVINNNSFRRDARPCRFLIK